jgi:hypothetical protein
MLCPGKDAREQGQLNVNGGRCLSLIPAGNYKVMYALGRHVPKIPVTEEIL